MNLKGISILFLFFCFLSPLKAQNGLPISISDYSAVPGEVFCVDIIVSDFDSIVSMQFSMEWDASLFQYSSSGAVDIPDPNFYGDNLFQPGVLTVSWNADQTIGYASAPDGTTIFEICFTAIGIPDPDTCSTINFINFPLNIEVITQSSGGMNVGLDIGEGNICLVEPLDIIDTLITNIGCDNQNVGAIDITMNGGLPPYTYSWEGTGFTATTEDISDLSAGMYYLTVTDTSVPSHVMIDSFFVEPPALPISYAGPDTALTCTNSIVTLFGTSTPPLDNDLFIEWYTPDGNFASNEFVNFVDVDSPGTYYFVVLNGQSLCADTSSLVVILDTTPPIANAGSAGQLTCSQTTLSLDGGASIGDDLLYVWTTSGMGNILSGDSTQTPLIDAPGTYVLTVIDTITGCESNNQSSVMVTQSSALPTAFAGNDTLLTCNPDQINLNGTGSSPGSYMWSTVDGIIEGDETTLFPLISQGGTYQLIVGSGPGCSDTSYVVVTEDMEPPIADAGPNQTMLCGQIIILLDGSGTDQGNEHTYLWSTMNGLIFEGETGLSPEIGGGGTYELLVTDTLNGCTATSTVMVAMDTITPVIDIEIPALINCNVSTVVLDASNSGPVPQFEYEWNTVFGSIVSGGDTPTPTVDSGGVYVVLVQNIENNCVAAGTVNVIMDTLPPLADPGMDTMIICEEPLVLDGSNSGTGAGVTYEWQTSNGNIVEGANTLTPLIDAGGEYVLITFSNENGCSDTASVVVDGGVQLVDPDVGMDFDICEDSTILMANQPVGTLGLWTSTSTSNILIPDSMDTWVQQMEAGSHIFVWTLSTDLCPDYASDTLTIQVEGTPIVNDDEYTFFSDLPVQELILTENDEIADLISWELSLFNEPTEVTITQTANGIYDLTNPNGFIGQLEMGYSLCSEICPTLCDTALVLLTIEEPIDTITTVPNAITPNGDGMNDFFIIPEISMTPELYPYNEFIVYNRWGDVVYQAKPYNNDWDGKDNSGNDLPQGTYYFVMRLDPIKGVLYKGDVTIMK